MDINKIRYMDYDKISDDIMYLSRNTVLKMNVSLSKKTSNGERRFFHSEFMYYSKYSNNKAVSIKRSYNYYLSIDKTDDRSRSIMIRLQDMIIIRSRLQDVAKWFNDDTFAMKNNKLILYKKKEPIIISNLTENKFLMFEPIVMTIENTGISQTAVRMTQSDMDTFTDIPVDTFYGFLYIMNTVDMFGYAQNMLNYIGRPAFGTNIHEFDNDISEPYDEVPKPTGKKRQIGVYEKRRSFFDDYED